jgi:hypothetical protein
MQGEETQFCVVRPVLDCSPAPALKEPCHPHLENGSSKDSWNIGEWAASHRVAQEHTDLGIHPDSRIWDYHQGKNRPEPGKIGKTQEVKCTSGHFLNSPINMLLSREN